MSDMDYVTKTLVFSSQVDKCETFKTPVFVSLEHIVESNSQTTTYQVLKILINFQETQPKGAVWYSGH